MPEDKLEVIEEKEYYIKFNLETRGDKNFSNYFSTTSLEEYKFYYDKVQKNIVENYKTIAAAKNSADKHIILNTGIDKDDFIIIPIDDFVRIYIHNTQ